MSEIATEIGKRIRSIRGDQSLIDFGKIIGVSRTMVSQYEKGVVAPRGDTLLKISQFGGVTLEWLITGEGPMHRPEADTGTCATDFTYPEGQALTDEHMEKVVKEDLVKYCAQFGVNKVVADLMLRETISEIIQAGKLSEGDQFGCLGNFMNDAQRRLAKWTGRQEQPVQDEE